MENKRCYLCDNTDVEIIHKGTRDNTELNVLKCKNCGLVFLSSFDHIHNEFYETSKMREDLKNIEAWKKSTFKDNSRRVNSVKDIISNQDVLDFGCGKGGFLDLAKNYANSISGIEIDRIIREELIKQGYSIWEDCEHCDRKFNVITLFHVIEHLEFPIEILRQCKELLKNGKGKIIIETPNANDALLSLYQSKEFGDFSYWSPHIYLYTQENLIALAQRADLRVEWVRQIQRYPLANHLYWLAKGKPGGHAVYDFMDSLYLNLEYEKILVEQHMCDTIMICLEV